jgi:hypothetical protein
MGRVAAAVVVLAGALSPAGASAALPPSDPATAVATPSKAAARTSLTLKLHYEMQCGQPGPGTVAVSLPALAHVPATLAPRAVLVDGHVAADAQLSGHMLRVPLPPPPRITCMVIGPGTLTITLARAFGFANPAKPGRYVIRAQKGMKTFAPMLAVG